MVKISVVMSVYNDEKYVGESIKSVLNQTLKDFEFIIVNDGSTDNSWKIINKFAKKDSRIKIIQNKTSIGLTKSLNKGIKISKGKYIARQDDDDISLPERLYLQYNFMESHQDIILCGTNVIYIDEKGSILRTRKGLISNPSKLKMRLRKCNSLFHPSIMFRNKNIFYREKFYYSQDYDLYLQLVSQGHKLFNLPRPLLMYRFKSDSISFSKRSKQIQFEEVARKLFFERCNSKKDSYESFNPKKILIQEDNTAKNTERTIEFFLKTGKFGYVKKLLKESSQLSFWNYKQTKYYIACNFPIIYKVYRRIMFKDNLGVWD